MSVNPRAAAGSRFPDARAARIAEIIEPTVTAHGLYLEELTLSGTSGTPTLAVVVDFESGTARVDLDTLAALSEALSAVLDQHEQETDLTHAASYQLEVTTPGATRPLTEARHFQRNLGRLLEIDREGHEPLVGRLLAAEEASITVQPILPAPKKGMTPKVGPDTQVALSEISRARVQVEFSHSE